ncbi:MAG: hypothetical protein CW338_02165 [Clostridiales bacterium]|nr:hypothetical protein [Clostridiales bacterium]
MNMGVNSVYLFFIIGMFFILSFVRNSTFIARRTVNLYSLAILVNIVSYAAYMLRSVLEQHQLVICANIDEILIYAGSPLIAFFLLLCSFRKNSPAYRAVCVSQAVYTLLCVSSAFTGWLFRVDSGAAYSRGPLSVIAFIYAGGLELIWVVSILIEYRSAQMQEKIKIVSVALIELVAIVMQVFDSSYKFSLLGSSFFLILFYIFQIEIEGKYDKMTKVLNKRCYSIVTGRLNNNYAIIVFDINGLKTVNDTRGHEYGDMLISAAAESIQAGAGENCSVYRIGGDEFVLITRSTDRGELDSITGRIRQQFLSRQQALGMEISAAAGSAVNTADMDYTNVFRLADAQMYEDKRDYYRQAGSGR